MKRLLDILGALTGLVLASPILLIFMFLVWRQDRHNPFYVAPRAGLDGRLFSMVKLRSMVKEADKKGGASTATTDMRITRVGQYIRRYKLDELTQLGNVLVGDMSLVGPRPQIKRATDFYTDIERKLLSVRPGITDFSSIVFSDEGEILKDHQNADLAYEQLIRPWKSRLSLFYIEKRGVWIDLCLCSLTIVAIFSRDKALAGVQVLLRLLGAEQSLIETASRVHPLVPTPPPGMDRVIMSADGNPLA